MSLSLGIPLDMLNPTDFEGADDSSAEKASAHAATPHTTISKEPFEIEISDVAFGGKGVGKVDGKTWFVEKAVTGDKLLVVELRDNGRYGDAAVLRYLQKSPLRLNTPPCAFHDKCGGCQWQEISYSDQLVWKKNFVASTLKRIGKIDQDFQITMEPSPQEFGYRGRILIRVHVKPTLGEKNVQFGYFARGSRILVPIDRCAIASAKINEFLEYLGTLSFPFIDADTTFRLEIQEIPAISQVRKSAELLVTLFPGDGKKEDFKKVVQDLSSSPLLRWCGQVFELKKAPFELFDRQDSIEFWTKPGLFQQVNIEHNHSLRSLIKSWVKEIKPQKILDVFCGSGNLSLHLGEDVSYIEGVELSKESILCAEKNLKSNQMAKGVYLSGDGEKHLWKCARNLESFDLVILDPPRQGFYKGVVPLKKLAPHSIIYVSCDPSTLARDLSYLCRNNEYRIEKVVCFDFFPQTYHVETAVLLKRETK